MPPDEVTVGGPGTCAFFPRTVPHAWKSTGRVLFMYTPPRVHNSRIDPCPDLADTRPTLRLSHWPAFGEAARPRLGGPLDGDMVPTRLMFLCLAITSFAPAVMGFRPGWWMTYYYGGLFVSWVLLSYAAVRRAARKDQTAKPPLVRRARQLPKRRQAWWPTAPRASSWNSARIRSPASVNLPPVFQSRTESMTAEPQADTASRALAKKRLIIVARDRIGLYGRLRRRSFKGLLKDEEVRIITDRRGPDRRRQLEVYIPDRRRAERRRFDVGPLLRTRGWAEVRLPKS